ncbi:MAG: AAA family ATPase [Roseburia faecis]
MRIDKLQVHNFRGFSDTEIVLNGKDAIFYGVNGMGKSSILDVCNLLFSRIMQEAALDEQITASLLGEKDVKVGEEEAKITLFLEDQGNNFHYYRKRIQGKICIIPKN